MIPKYFPFIIISNLNVEVFGWEEPVFVVIFNISPRIMENPERGVQLFSPKNLLMTSAGLQKSPFKSDSNYFINLLYGTMISKNAILQLRSKVAPHPYAIYHSIRLCTRNPNHFTESKLDHWEPRYELSLNFLEGHFIFWEFLIFLDFLPNEGEKF